MTTEPGCARRISWCIQSRSNQLELKNSSNADASDSSARRGIVQEAQDLSDVVGCTSKSFQSIRTSELAVEMYFSANAVLDDSQPSHTTTRRALVKMSAMRLTWLLRSFKSSWFTAIASIQIARALSGYRRYGSAAARFCVTDRLPSSPTGDSTVMSTGFSVDPHV